MNQLYNQYCKQKTQSEIKGLNYMSFDMWLYHELNKFKETSKRYSYYLK